MVSVLVVLCIQDLALHRLPLLPPPAKAPAGQPVNTGTDASTATVTGTRLDGPDAPDTATQAGPAGVGAGAGGAVGAATARDGVSWAVLGKHLCGAATDYALRAVARCLPDTQPADTLSEPVQAQSAPGTPSTGTLQGIGLATCCHHR